MKELYKDIADAYKTETAISIGNMFRLTFSKEHTAAVQLNVVSFSNVILNLNRENYDVDDKSLNVVVVGRITTRFIFV